MGTPLAVSGTVDNSYSVVGGNCQFQHQLSIVVLGAAVRLCVCCERHPIFTPMAD